MNIKGICFRLLSVTLSVILSVSFLPLITFASETECNHAYENGYCSLCDSEQAAVLLTEETISQYGLSSEYIGYYAIGNAGQLYSFSDIVNTYDGEEKLNAVLTADIVVNENVLTDEGELSENHDDFLQWQPIGYLIEEIDDYSGYYEGTFDGNNHSISGLYFNNYTESNIGLFGYVRYGSCIKNLTLKDSYFSGEYNVAGICAIMHHSPDYDGTTIPEKTYIENCVNYATIVSTNTAAGICATPGIDARISKCVNNGKIYVADVTDPDTVALYAGGITGQYGEIENCINNGSIKVTDEGTFNKSYAGGITAINDYVIGCSNTGAVSAIQSAGGICGFLSSGGIISKSFNSGEITVSEQAVGGIVGECNFPSTDGTYVTDCYNTGKVTGDSFVGGIMGVHGRYGHEGYDEVMAVISSVYNIGDTEGRLYVGAITGLTGDYGCIKGSFYLTGSAKKTDGTVVAGYNWYGTAEYEMQMDDSVGYVLGITNEQFATGEITFALNGYKSGEDVSWYQNIDRGDTPQPYPSFDGEIVYFIDDIYTNIPVEEDHTHKYENGFCTHTDCTVIQEGTVITPYNYTEYGLDGSYIGYYTVTNAGQLYWVAKLSEIDSSVNIVLLSNIIDNEGILDTNGNPVDGDYRSWSPIGVYSDGAYSGVFDGNGKTISGLYYSDTTKTAIGFFGCCENATIRNLNIADSYFQGKYWVGGICGIATETVIENCTNSACVEGNSSSIGGICGSVYLTEIRNCVNRGNISSNIKASATTNGTIGGICGSLASSQISDSKNYGSVKAEVYAGGIVGSTSSDSAIITNCYNEGEIFASSVRVGGIVGSAGSKSNIITKCYNKGSVTGLRHVGGICGSATGPSYITNCYNTASLSATESIVGGICGYIELTDTDKPKGVEACYNMGKVTAPLYIGGVVGQIGDNSTETYATSLLKGCYYLEQCAYDSENNYKTGVGCYNTYPEIYDAPDSEFGAQTVDKGQLTSGELAYTLQSLQSADEETGEIPMVWGQTSNSENAHPVLTSNEAHKVIGSNGVAGYSVSNIGDVNANGELDITDYQEIVNQAIENNHEQIGTAEYDDVVNYDINGDGAIDALDAALMNRIIRGQKTIDVYATGDFDFNGVAFEPADLSAMKVALEDPAKLTTAQKRACDLNCDGIADDKDSVIFELQYCTNCNDCQGKTVIEYTWSENFSSCTASAYCSACNTIKNSETVQTTDKITKEATCTAYGVRVFTAEFDNALFGTSYYEKSIPKCGHTYSDITYTWSADYSTCTATTNCSVCSAEDIKETVNAVLNITPATCIANGRKEYTATFTDGIFETQVRTKTISATGHFFGDAIYTWSNNYTVCSAKGICGNCGNEIEESGTISYNGNTVVATFTSSGLETQTVEVQTNTLTTSTQVYNYVSSQLASGVTDITVDLPADASADLITAIRRAICDADNVADGSINLTVTGATVIPDNIGEDDTGDMKDGIAFGQDNSILATSGGGTETVPQLRSVSLPDATYIGIFAFELCSNLETLYAPKVQTVGQGAFTETALSVIDLPEATSVGVAAFAYGNAQITYVNLPKASSLGVDLFNCWPGNNNFADGATVKLTAPGTEFTWLQIDDVSISSEPDLFSDDSLSSINLVLHTDKASQVKKPFFGSTYKWTFSYLGTTISYTCASITTEG